MIERRPDFAFTNGTPYLLGVYSEILKEIWPRYIETALYAQVSTLALTLLHLIVINCSEKTLKQFG